MHVDLYFSLGITHLPTDEVDATNHAALCWPLSAVSHSFIELHLLMQVEFKLLLLETRFKKAVEDHKEGHLVTAGGRRRNTAFCLSSLAFSNKLGGGGRGGEQGLFIQKEIWCEKRGREGSNRFGWCERLRTPIPRRI